MGRFLLVPVPSQSHTGCMLAIARELIDRGEDVFVAVAEGHGTAFAQAGCSLVWLGRHQQQEEVEARNWLHRVRETHALYEVLRYRASAKQILKVAICATGPDLVVADTMAPWGIRAAVASATPFATLHTNSVVTKQYLRADAKRELGPQLTQRFERMALEQLYPELHPSMKLTRLALVNTLRELQPLADSLDERFHFVGPIVSPTTGPAELSSELERRAAERQTLYVSAGTQISREPAFFQRIAEAFAGTDWLVVMSSVRPDQLGPIPSNVVVHQKIAQIALLKHCDVFVTHAGMGSVMEAIAWRVPMILVPGNFSTRVIARQVELLGAGVVLPIGADGERFRSSVTGIASDISTRSALQALSAEMDKSDSGAAAAADLLQGHRR